MKNNNVEWMGFVGKLNRVFEELEQLGCTMLVNIDIARKGVFLHILDYVVFLELVKNNQLETKRLHVECNHEEDVATIGNVKVVSIVKHGDIDAREYVDSAKIMDIIRQLDALYVLLSMGEE